MLSQASAFYILVTPTARGTTTGLRHMALLFHKDQWASARPVGMVNSSTFIIAQVEMDGLKIYKVSSSPAYLKRQGFEKEYHEINNLRIAARGRPWGMQLPKGCCPVVPMRAEQARASLTLRGALGLTRQGSQKDKRT